MGHSSRVQLTIDPSALEHNLKVVRKITPDAAVMAVVKADGYGHGIEVVVDALHGADEFAVTDLDDVAVLRKLGIKKPISTLSGALNLAQLPRYNENTHLVLFDVHQLEALESVKESLNLFVWLKLDSGMGRLGFQPHQFHSVLERVSALSCVAGVGLLSHLANADEPANKLNLQQVSIFRDVLSGFNFESSSLLNSAGVCAFAEHAFTHVRPGIMLYGASPLRDRSASDLGLLPAMTLTSRLIAIRHLQRGDAVGYGSTHTVTEATRVGVIACGYGDGYPRHARTGTPVFINGYSARLLGRVSMDMVTVELNDIPAKVGDQVEMWGPENPIEQVAKYSDTISYELFCRLTNRVERILTNG